MNDLYAFLAQDIPKSKPVDIGFLEIIGKAHDENINSRIYAYFLDQEVNEELSSLFLSALTNLIKRRSGKDIYLSSWRVVTEESTEKGNRIDIVIHDVEGRSAILIENKIYHYLHNDLMDYWQHLGLQDQDQMGVLLTLEKHEIPEEVSGKFINITHYDWCSEVRSLGLPAGLESKIYSYLNDFFKTIENLTNSTEMNDQAKFFFQNPMKVNEIKATYDEGKRYIEDQIDQLSQKLGWSTYGNSYGWRNIWDKEHKCEVFYTIAYNDLLEGRGELQLIIEMNGDVRKRAEEAYEILKNDEFFTVMKEGVRASGYLHLGFIPYNLELEELSNLSEFLYNEIKTKFEPVMKKLLKHYYPNWY